MNRNLLRSQSTERVTYADREEGYGNRRGIRVPRRQPLTGGPVSPSDNLALWPRVKV